MQGSLYTALCVIVTRLLWPYIELGDGAAKAWRFDLGKGAAKSEKSRTRPSFLDSSPSPLKVCNSKERQPDWVL